jgi:hypothetical protein
MKRLLLAALLIVGCAGMAYADENTIQIDATFTKATTWLSQQHLSLTGSQTNRNDGAAFGQEIILFFGEAVGNPDPRLSSVQRELGAKRAAVVTAQRAVAEYLDGFVLVGDTLVKDGMLQSDTIRSAVTGLVRGATVVVQDYNKEKDLSIAIIKLGLHGPTGLASVIYDKIFKDDQLKGKLTELDGKQAQKYEHAVAAVPVAYDGLIIDATEQNFRPALINRIFSNKKELLYDPSKVSQKVLVEQGCGEYTNTVEKAKAALDTRGIKNPLIVKAVGTVSAADLQVSDDDAVTIYSANQKGNFLAMAKVAFVLK